MFNPLDWRPPCLAELAPLQDLPRFTEKDLLAGECPDVVRRSSKPHLHELFHQGYTVLPGAVPASLCGSLGSFLGLAQRSQSKVWSGEGER